MKTVKEVIEMLSHFPQDAIVNQAKPFSQNNNDQSLDWKRVCLHKNNVVIIGMGAHKSDKWYKETTATFSDGEYIKS